MKKIKSLQGLKRAAINKRAVVFHGRPVPAAVVMNFTGALILSLIKRGLPIYEKNKK